MSAPPSRGLVALLGLGAFFFVRPRKRRPTATVLAQQPSEVRRLRIESVAARWTWSALATGPGGTRDLAQSATLLFGLEQKLLPMLAYRR